MFKDKPLNFNPGERYEYSNSNYNLLAYIIEKLSGKNYGEFLQKNIFAPLGMENSGHHGDTLAIIKNMAEGYQAKGAAEIEKAPYLDWTIKTGNGSLYSTVYDLYKFERALYTEKLLKKSSLKKMFKKHVDDAIGYGWFMRKRHNRNAVYINGRSPGFTTYLCRYTDDDVCIIVLGNNYVPVATNIGVDLAAILFGEKYEIPHLKPVQLTIEQLDALVGSYKFGPGYVVPNHIIRFIRKGDKLVIREAGGTSELALLPVSETEFFHRGYWTYIIFEKDETGKASRVYYTYFKDHKAEKIK